MSGSVALQHVRELAARKSKAYELLLALDGNSSADESCFQSLSRAVDRLLFNEISLDSAALTSLSALVSEPAEDLGSTLAVLDVALSEAEPERARLQILISGFSGWLTAASHAARPHVLSILPNIAVHVSELKNSGVETLISLFNACSSEREMDLIARCIAGYQESSGEILLAASEIGSRFVRSGVDALIERMLTAVPVDAMLESKDAEALLPAIAKIRVDRADDAVLSAAAAVCIAAARQNNSSALNLARQLGARRLSVAARIASRVPEGVRKHRQRSRHLAYWIRHQATTWSVPEGRNGSSGSLRGRRARHRAPLWESCRAGVFRTEDRRRQTGRAWGLTRDLFLGGGRRHQFAVLDVIIRAAPSNAVAQKTGQPDPERRRIPNRNQGHFLPQARLL